MTIPRSRAAWRIGRSILPILALVVTLAGCTDGAATVTPGLSSSPPVSLGPGDGAFVIPKPGQLDVHPIAADSFAARIDGRHVVLTIAYTSGVEPCSVLDTIVVRRGDHSVAITLREGHGPGNQVCIMIARVMHTQVDLGDLDPGTYTITDTDGWSRPDRGGRPLS